MGRIFMKKGGVTLVRSIQCGTPQVKKPFERSRLRWENQVRKDIQMVELNAYWHILAMNREKWHDLCLTV